MSEKLQWNFQHTYADLSQDLYSEVVPTVVEKPTLVLFNEALAQDLGISVEGVSETSIAQQLSGNALPDNAKPIAQAYAGHQFGHFTMLGDGRAILLGEQFTPSGKVFDVQLKGAGATPYSRRGDGRATLYSMLREYLISEAMHYLGIRTSRSLAVVTTGEKVYREYIHDGAVLCRIASSHIRVGTFEYVYRFAPDELAAFTQYVIKRHCPEFSEEETAERIFLWEVALRQIDLITQWMRVGFIHGVMNTDNMSIVGETIDYGPCAFMNAYDPQTVYSSIDVQGRYAFANQPFIMQWNIACFGDAMKSTMSDDLSYSNSIVYNVVRELPEIFEESFYNMMRKKLGIIQNKAEDIGLIKDLLRVMENAKMDYTNTFLYLQNTPIPDDKEIYEHKEFVAWCKRWEQTIAPYKADALELMQKHNPVVIPRNYWVEKALTTAAFDGDFTLFHQLLNALKNPYNYHADIVEFMKTPTNETGYKTFCGT
jgi:serine/tyrosine/threonine adenylyltransferase